VRLELTEEEVRHIATRRAFEPFSGYMKLGAVVIILSLIFLIATELYFFLYVLAVLWTLAMAAITYMVYQKRKAILRGFFRI
jgi:hypothetical protein